MLLSHRDRSIPDLRMRIQNAMFCAQASPTSLIVCFDIVSISYRGLLLRSTMDIEMDTDVSEGWSVVSHRDKQKGCNNVSTEEEMDSHKNDKSDQCLIGSFVYQTQPSSSVVSRTRPLACETTSSDRDLIGTPFFISQHSEDTIMCLIRSHQR